MSFSNFKDNALPYHHNVNSQHHVIQNNNNFVLDRKLITIHSNDRDYSKYPNANNFHIKLGSQFDNVQSVRLVDYQFPKKTYVFSDKYCNTKLVLYILGDISGIAISTHTGFTDGEKKIILDNSNNKTKIDKKEITIPEGNYTGDELAKIINNNADVSCNYSDVEDKLFLYTNSNKKFFINFRHKPNYDNVNYAGQQEIFDQHTNWGIGYNMGFSKKFIFSSNGIFSYQNNGEINEQLTGTHYVKSEHPILVSSDPMVYLDINKLNQLDEIVPYSGKTTSKYNNNSSYKNNGAFAKINLQNNDFASNPSKIKDIFYSDTPLKSLDRLELKVRYHDGRMVDFKNKEYSIVLEINCLRDKQFNGKTINVPSFYPL
jgi:hypothetical protein